MSKESELTLERLEDALSRPLPEDVETAARLQGDVLVLGAGGKMGPTLVQRIARSIRRAEADMRVFAASRFSDPAQRAKLSSSGAGVIPVDLLDEDALVALPHCPNVIYLVGMKFGATGQEALTWAMNTYLPGRVAERFSDANIVALSTGNLYPQVPVHSRGCVEEDVPEPVGEYAQSVLGRERIFQHFSLQNGTPTCLIRLNYAVEPRYGVLVDIAQRVYNNQPISLSMGYVNVVWQGYANSVVFRALEHCTSPADILNLTGPEVLSVRELAESFAAHFGTEPIFDGHENETAYLNDAGRCHEIFGLPDLLAPELVEMVADWLDRGGATLGKPTMFEISNGKY